MSTRKTARDASRPPGGATNAVKKGAHALDLSSCVNTKDRLLRVAEYLFAREGVWSARVRDINELAGQRNASALHYHFGSRRGLIKAVMLRHQLEIDVEQTPLLDELEKRTDYAVRDILEIVVVPLVARLDSPSGRDFLRIIPQIFQQAAKDFIISRRKFFSPVDLLFISLTQSSFIACICRELGTPAVVTVTKIAPGIVACCISHYNPHHRI